MLLAVVAAVALLGPGPPDEAADLVARLGSAHFDERERAAAALKRLGGVALPALRAARSAPDLEIQARARALYDEVEPIALLEPTMVRLDFRDRPVAEVVDQINRRSGMRIVPGPTSPARRRGFDDPTWPDRKVTLMAPDPVPFWEAIGRLCAVAGLRRDYVGPGLAAARVPDLVLVPGTATAPTADAGAFRVEILRIGRTHDRDFAAGLQVDAGPPRPVPPAAGPGAAGGVAAGVATATFAAELLFSAEPRLRIVGLTPPGHLEARDDERRSLLRGGAAPDTDPRVAARPAEPRRLAPPLDAPAPPRLWVESGRRRGGWSSPLRIALTEVDPPAGRLARLRGVMAVAVVARQPDPLVVPLAGPTGVVVGDDRARVTIHELKANPDQPRGEVELTYEAAEPAARLRVRGPGIAPLELDRPNDLLEQELEFLDEDGQRLPWTFLRVPGRPGEFQGRMRLLVRTPDALGRVDFARVRLLAHHLAAAAVEVPFAFADVPLP